MTPHAHGGASAWDPTYATTPRFVHFLLLSNYQILLSVLIMMMEALLIQPILLLTHTNCIT